MIESFTPGTRIYQYEIVRLLGAGRQAEVYLARHTLLGVSRAIKALPRGRPDISTDLYEEYCERYKREWQLAATVERPNLIQVYDLFETDDGLFAVVEYAPKGTLRRKLESGRRFPEEWVIKVLRECAEGLKHLHRLESPSLVHCYVNPDTVVFDASNRAVISNFGRARAGIDRLAKHQKLVPNIEESDDADYQAPEFRSGKIAPTTDVYSLGCIAFEMLTGLSVASARVHSPKQIEPTVPDWLDRVVVRMLSDYPGFSTSDRADPSKRYVDMDHLLDNLHPPGTSIPLDQMASSFSFEELRNICMLLNVEHEEIPGADVRTYAREMWRYLAHRGRTAELLEILHAERPDVDWQST
jgi:serine/threonine-protein kinase